MRSFDPRKDKMIDIEDDEDYMNQSLKDFKPPKSDKTMHSIDDGPISARMIGGMQPGRMANEDSLDELRFFEK